MYRDCSWSPDVDVKGSNGESEPIGVTCEGAEGSPDGGEGESRGDLEESEDNVDEGECEGITDNFVVGDTVADADGAAGVVETVGDRVMNDAKFHFGPMCPHPSTPISARPGQKCSSPASFGGPFPH